MDNGHLHVAETLMKNGADVNYRNKVRVLIPVTYNVANDKAVPWYYGEPVGCSRYEQQTCSVCCS